MKLSVILPVHTYHKYLDESIASVLNQSLDDYEVIVVTNGTDISFKDKLKRKYDSTPNLEIIDTEFVGLPFALNIGIAHAKSEIVVRMDSDDVSTPDRLEKIWQLMSCDKEVDILASNFFFINEMGKRQEKISKLPSSNKYIRRLLPFRCIIPHPTVAARKRVILENGGYMSGFISEDYDLWIRLRRNKTINFKILSEQLLGYRVHADQATSIGNIWKIFCYDFTLKLRELMLTREIIYCFALPFSVFDFMYCYIRGLLKKAFVR